MPNEPIPENPLGARNWLKFGDDVSPQFGAVLVFWRVAVNSWLGHVGFYWSEDDTYFHVLAGNQSDAVNIQKHPKSKLLGARWPSSVPAPGLRRMMTGTQLLRMYTEDA